MSRYGYPEQYGFDADGHCGHCGCARWQWWRGMVLLGWAIDARTGTFCLACCRWIEYHGPPRDWGDGMEVRDMETGPATTESKEPPSSVYDGARRSTLGKASGAV